MSFTASAYDYGVVTSDLLNGGIKDVGPLGKSSLLWHAGHFKVGQVNIVETNSDLNIWLPKKHVRINRNILKPSVKSGVVINLAEYRLFYYGNDGVKVYSVGVGKKDWDTPVGRTTIIGKRANPTWTPPASIIAEHAKLGKKLKKVYPGGKNNPLGLFAMRLGIPGYLIHGSNFKYGIGKQVSHGCIRMYAPDIEELFRLVKVGTKVTIINEPYKISEIDGKIWVEIHKGTTSTPKKSNKKILKYVLSKVSQKSNVDIKKLEHAIMKRNGIPMEISK
jgi:L,D-transpeptidase ErfK/SrfK